MHQKEVCKFCFNTINNGAFPLDPRGSSLCWTLKCSLTNCSTLACLTSRDFAVCWRRARSLPQTGGLLFSLLFLWQWVSVLHLFHFQKNEDPPPGNNDSYEWATKCWMHLCKSFRDTKFVTEGSTLLESCHPIWPDYNLHFPTSIHVSLQRFH